MPAWTVAPKSRSGSASIRSANTVAEREEDLGDRLGLGVQAQNALALGAREHRGYLFAHLAHQAAVLDGDVGVAPREREQLEDERDELGLVVHRLLQVLRHQVDVVVGGLRGGELPSSSSIRSSQSRRTASTSSCSFVPK